MRRIIQDGELLVFNGATRDLTRIIHVTLYFSHERTYKQTP